MRKDIKFPTHAEFPLASMIQKNETTTLVLALAITLGLIGGCFFAIAQSTGADLRRLLGSNSENPTSPATNELNSPAQYNKAGREFCAKIHSKHLFFMQRYLREPA